MRSRVAVASTRTRRGPILVRIDPESGERRGLLSFTPRSYAVSLAHATFTAPQDVVIGSLGDAAALARSRREPWRLMTRGVRSSTSRVAERRDAPTSATVS